MNKNDIDFQIDALESYGVDEIYIENPCNGEDKNTRLEELIKRLKTDDVLVIYELDRLGKTIKGLQELVECFSLKNIELVVIKDNIDTTTKVGRYLFYLVCILGDMERSILQEFTRIGIEIAKLEGRTGGRPGKKDDEINEVLKLHYKGKYSVKEISGKTGWATSTIYKYIRKDKKKP